jgi:hypothetical protein
MVFPKNLHQFSSEKLFITKCTPVTSIYAVEFIVAVESNQGFASKNVSSTLLPAQVCQITTRKTIGTQIMFQIGFRHNGKS